MPGITRLTPAQAADVFCPLLQGACKAGGCHWWVWDELTEKKRIALPDDIVPPRMPGRFDESMLLDPIKAHQTHGERLRAELGKIIGRQVEGGTVVNVVASPDLLRGRPSTIEVTIEKRETGDCCMRRAAR